jgi:hypothetical protein
MEESRFKWEILQEIIMNAQKLAGIKGLEGF